MIRKFIVLLLIIGVGYFGYLVWNNLTPAEKTLVGQKIYEAACDAREFAKEAADKLSITAKEAIKRVEEQGQPPLIIHRQSATKSRPARPG